MKAAHAASATTVCIASCVLVTCLNLPAVASPCMPAPVVRGDPYHYLLALADALGHAESAVSGVDSVRVGPEEGGPDDFTIGTNLMIALKRGMSDYECAQQILSPYRTLPQAAPVLRGDLAGQWRQASRRALRSSAVAAVVALQSLAESQTKTMLQLKNVMNGTLDAGSQAQQTALVADTRDKALHALFLAVLMASNCPIEPDPTTGKMSRLVLTAGQRDEILTDLLSTFGDEIKGGMKEGQFPLTAAAAELYSVLGNPGYSLRPQE